MKDKIDFLKGLLDEIDESKRIGKSGVYRLRIKISDEIGEYVKNYFRGKGYDTEIGKCSRCSGAWNIIIRFR